MGHWIQAISLPSRGNLSIHVLPIDITEVPIPNKQTRQEWNQGARVQVETHGLSACLPFCLSACLLLCRSGDLRMSIICIYGRPTRRRLATSLAGIAKKRASTTHSNAVADRCANQTSHTVTGASPLAECPVEQDKSPTAKKQQDMRPIALDLITPTSLELTPCSTATVPPEPDPPDRTSSSHITPETSRWRPKLIYGLYDPDLGSRVSAQYHPSLQHHDRRVGRYGADTASAWKRGSTPEEAQERWKMHEEAEQWNVLDNDDLSNDGSESSDGTADRIRSAAVQSFTIDEK
nr:hypothetical protein CFP56_64727 [Quercus suber]